MWEQGARPMALWGMVKVFLAKPDEGLRLIHLMAFAAGTWGRIRQSRVAKWEAELADQGPSGARLARPATWRG